MPSTPLNLAYTANRAIYVPDVWIEKDDPTYVYVPLRGYGIVMAAFDVEDRCIGWIRADTLGYRDVRSWMAATGWRDGGY